MRIINKIWGKLSLGAQTALSIVGFWIACFLVVGFLLPPVVIIGRWWFKIWGV